MDGRYPQCDDYFRTPNPAPYQPDPYVSMPDNESRSENLNGRAMANMSTTSQRVWSDGHGGQGYNTQREMYPPMGVQNNDEFNRQNMQDDWHQGPWGHRQTFGNYSEHDQWSQEQEQSMGSVWNEDDRWENDSRPRGGFQSTESAGGYDYNRAQTNPSHGHFHQSEQPPQRGRGSNFSRNTRSRGHWSASGSYPRNFQHSYDQDKSSNYSADKGFQPPPKPANYSADKGFQPPPKPANYSTDKGFQPPPKPANYSADKRFQPPPKPGSFDRPSNYTDTASVESSQPSPDLSKPPDHPAGKGFHFQPPPKPASFGRPSNYTGVTSEESKQPRSPGLSAQSSKSSNTVDESKKPQNSGGKAEKEDKSKSQNELEEVEEEDTSFCKLCNISFENAQKFYCHTRGLLHTQRQMAADHMKAEGTEEMKENTSERKSGKCQKPFPKAQTEEANYNMSRGGHTGSRELLSNAANQSTPQSNKPAAAQSCKKAWKTSITDSAQSAEANEGQEEEDDDECEEYWDEEDWNEEDWNQEVSQAALSGYTCELCDITCTGTVALRSHKNGRMHKQVEEAVKNGSK